MLPKPIESGDAKLARKFSEFLEHGKNLTLAEITASIAKQASVLRGRYPVLRSLDAVQIATALDVGADVFITNDKQLSRMKEIKVIVLSDYLTSP